MDFKSDSRRFFFLGKMTSNLEKPWDQRDGTTLLTTRAEASPDQRISIAWETHPKATFIEPLLSVKNEKLLICRMSPAVNNGRTA
ncbi:hypothetical protein BG74_09115 [Sodalis-like endosymbiont of Proechinophthirus fluctus]|nr:hypothetical protein BG74_09115 [Sodalis-like endosymbiont of Proechinophthirus fluctus]